MKSLFKTPFDVIAKSITTWSSNLNYSTVLEIAKQRVLIVAGVIILFYIAIIFRLGDLMLFQQKDKLSFKDTQSFAVQRRDISDRNGEVLATNIITASAYANPKQILNTDEASKKLAQVVNLSQKEIKKRLEIDKNFTWMARHISPKTQQDINSLGIPGVYMQRDQTRVYPHGPLLSHIIGMCGIDGDGLSGIEQYFDTDLQQGEGPLELSIDLRVQHILRTELLSGVEEFRAMGANAIVIKVKTGEILGMVSLPDFDPNKPSAQNHDVFFNKNTLGTFEPGSTFKILNVAIALESGKANLKSIFDGTNPIKIGRFCVKDFKGLGRPMSLTEAFVTSSNIANIKIAQTFGISLQKQYMKRFGALDKVKIELFEIGSPLIPKDWREPSLMTMSYGYGISQTPIQLISIIGSLVNNGKRIQPTLLKKGQVDHGQVVCEKTSRLVRRLMRLTAMEGTARKANIPGYNVFAKTGTTWKKVNKHGYGSDSEKQRITTCMAGFPEENPEILMLVMVDDPKPTKESGGYATAGWNAAKIAGKIITKLAPFYVQPNHVQKTVAHESDDLPVQVFSTGYVVEDE